jgi:hypothetical protein
MSPKVTLFNWLEFLNALVDFIFKNTKLKFIYCPQNPYQSFRKNLFGKKIIDIFSNQSRASLSPKVTRPDTSIGEN